MVRRRPDADRGRDGHREIRLGTFVASPNFRHPVTFARQLLALDDISDGRFMLGIGSGGGGGYDDQVLGNPELTGAQKADRIAEFVELSESLLSRPITNFSGEYFTAVDARSAPGCVQRPRLPFLIAANGPKAMRVAARFGQGWVTTGAGGEDLDEWWRGVARTAEKFDGVLAEQHRDRSTVDRYLNLDSAPVFSLSSVAAFEDAVGRAAELGFTDVVTHWPRHDGVYAGREIVLEQVAADVLPALTGRPAPEGLG